MPEAPSDYNARIISELRANNGHAGGEWEGIPLLILHHTGTQSGVRRANPVAYLPEGEGYLIWAANGGAPRSPDWYHNLKANPQTTIEVGGETIDVDAQEASGAERERLFSKATGHYPQLLEASRKTERVIPFLVLTPSSDI